MNKIKTPETRIDTICNQTFPSIENGYKDNFWTYQEAIEQVDKQKTQGLSYLEKILDEGVKDILTETLESSTKNIKYRLKTEENDRKKYYV